MAIDKDTTPRYKVPKTQVNTILEAKILTEHGDTVTVTGLVDDPTDSTFYLVELADA